MSNIQAELTEWGQKVALLLQQQQCLLTTAESCTGGWLSKIMTDLAGSSEWFDRGFITYSNQAKHELLDVPWETLTQQGAVSEAVVSQMAQGALAHSQAQISVAISGIAGPTGGTETKPVGTVCFAWASQQQLITTTQQFSTTADRETIRALSVKYALQGLHQQLQS